MWHYLQAEKNKAQEIAAKNDEQNLLILLLNPELYEAMNKEKGNEEYDNLYFVEQQDEEGRVSSTMTTEEFKELAKQRRILRQNEVLVSQTIEGEEVFNNSQNTFDYPMSVERT